MFSTSYCINTTLVFYFGEACNPINQIFYYKSTIFCTCDWFFFNFSFREELEPLAALPCLRHWSWRRLGSASLLLPLPIATPLGVSVLLQILNFCVHNNYYDLLSLLRENIGVSLTFSIKRSPWTFEHRCQIQFKYKWFKLCYQI